MNSLKPIRIIGGGLAGLVLGIGLRRRGVPVTISEAGRYPRHRVCGEFISGKGQGTLGRLGLLSLVCDAGAIRARTARFCIGTTSYPEHTLANPALCLSRYVLDAVLAREFVRLGGILHEAERCGKCSGEGVVRATGRRASAATNGWLWFGLKAHLRNMELSADLEMHTMPGGYVGLCRLPGDEINVCGLFRRSPRDCRHIEDRVAPLRGSVAGSLHRRISAASFIPETICSVGGLNLAAQAPGDGSEFCVGDSFAMVAPVTGNGMSMAFETAELALEPLETYSRGEMCWLEACRSFGKTCRSRFHHRLGWGGLLNRFMFSPYLCGRLAKPLLGSNFVWQFMFARTR